ncbi:hypothetical protein XELAEV_18017702mg [Xenopus laevis]|uniref:Uncharacterized protein n=1 Tax=Xenopus laevis TaxID=8355 RepID=A0A974DBW0_XENLA|nr:hypothetical protein XELAEV_18017702mg [Xenopus laevis]
MVVYLNDTSYIGWCHYKRKERRSVYLYNLVSSYDLTSISFHTILYKHFSSWKNRSSPEFEWIMWIERESGPPSPTACLP